MSTKNEASFTTGADNRSLKVVRQFDAPVARVWTAWTDASLLDQWWAPKPWKAETKSMDFRPGGMWLYAMVGPNEAERHWSKVSYNVVEPITRFSSTDVFCDENGIENRQLPLSSWDHRFVDQGQQTTVEIHIQFEEEASLKQQVEMGFKQGFTMGMNNLEELLSR